MTGTKIFLSLLIGIITYLCINFIGGSQGWRAYEELKRSREKIAENILELQDIRDQLHHEELLLRTDAAQIRLEARALNYHSENEYLVHIEGISLAQSQLNAGNYLEFEDSAQQDRRPFFRTVATCVGLACFFLLVLIKRLSPS